VSDRPLNRSITIRNNFFKTIFDGFMRSNESLQDDFTEQIRDAANNSKCIFLDVRSIDEIQADPCTIPTIHGEVGPALDKATSLHLSKNPKGKLPDLNQQKTIVTSNLLIMPSDPVIVFCRSGMRASRVKQLLEDRGYQNVMNAGGFANVNNIFPK